MNDSDNPLKSCFSAFAIIIAIGFFILTLFALSLRATHFVILGFSSTILFGCIAHFIRHKTTKVKIAILISFIPYLWLLPFSRKLNSKALLESRFLEHPSLPWFQGIPEQELIYIGEKLGYTNVEKTSLQKTGFLADEYHTLNKSNLFQNSYSILLDSWITDRQHFWYLKGNPQAPLLIFLHGSGGNFKSYQHWFTPKAHKLGINMAFPTWGMGFWSVQKLEARLLKLITKLKEQNEFNHQEVYICGLSQGSLTGLKAIAQGNLKVKGFISISGAPPLSTQEINHLKGTPIYFIHGIHDERSSIKTCRNIFNQLNKDTPQSKLEEYSENHTLIKVKNKEVINNMLEWIIK